MVGRKRMPHNYITPRVRPFIVRFYQEHGRKPTTLEALEHFPEMIDHQAAVERCIERTTEQHLAAPPVDLPDPDMMTPRPVRPPKTGDKWDDTLNEVDYLCEVLIDTATQTGKVDAAGYDKLVRLRLEVEEKRKERAQSTAEKKMQLESIEAIVQRGRALDTARGTAA